MIILHEDLREEAFHVARALKHNYKIPIEIRRCDLSDLFKPIPQFDGFHESVESIYSAIMNDFPKKAALILTERDLYSGESSKNDEWVFGYCIGDIQVLSTARLKGNDNTPLKQLQVQIDKYFKRLATMATHEVGHSLVKSGHHQMASWVNAQTGFAQPLGAHCIDNTCVMYEVVDINTPPESEGYLLIGDQKRYDAGLDEHIERLRQDFFCNNCRDALIVPEKYRS